MSGESEVGFSVPGGDPARLLDAARCHEAMADDLDGHAAVIDHTAGSLTPVWQGAAATGYQRLSHEVAARFRTAADCSRQASATVRRYAHELEQYQQQCRHCQAEAEHWQQQVTADKAKLDHAEHALRAAQTAVAEAQREVRAAATAGAATAHPAAAGALAGAQARLGAAQSRLAHAQTAVGHAQRTLQHAEDELHHWQARGRRVSQQANEAGNAASRSLGSLSVPPPPTAAAPVNAASGSPSSGVSTVAAGGLGGAVGLGGAAGLGGNGGGTPAGSGSTSVTATDARAGVPTGAGTTAGGPNLPAVNSGARQGAITFGDLEEIGRRFGWSHSELEAWWQVISDESGGNPAATNASSGAFGIGQFLGATYKEYLPYGAGSSNPLDQLNAMAQYIHNRYGTPTSALAHENGYHWY